MVRSFCFFLLWSISVFLVESANETRRAEWMSGRWGIGYRIQTDAPTWDSYNVSMFIDQLRTIKGNPGWIIVNLSGPAHGGDIYLSHHPLLWELGNIDATPGPDGRDLFKELLDAIHGEGLKVIAYMAGQGPALLKLQRNFDLGRDTFRHAHDFNATTERSPSLDRWRAYVNETYGDPDENSWQNCKQAYVEQIVDYYAKKYGTDIDGWWFDQGTYTDRELLEATCHEYNPDAVFAVNSGTKVPLQVNNPQLEDYTFGHPSPISKTKPSSIDNLPMLNAIETTSDGFLTKDNWDVLGHMFMPMGTTWNGRQKNLINLEWNESQAVDWMSRALESEGAWTWNIPREDFVYPGKMSILREDFVDFLNLVVVQLDLSSAPSLVPSTSTPPSLQPSSQLSRSPSFSPSEQPSVSQVPSLLSSGTPSQSVLPSRVTSSSPSHAPSKVPSASPSETPSVLHSQQPSQTPTGHPSAEPSVSPSNGSVSPSSVPSLSKPPSVQPVTIDRCPAVNGTITWSGPCTYETILFETGCELNDIIGSVEELQEACDAAAFAFSAINDETRNFDERYFNGGGPFNNDRETDGEDKEMTMSANRLYRVRDNIAPSRRILMPEYDSLLNYTAISYFGKKVRDKKFYIENDTALEILDDYPPYMSNFNLTSGCELNSIMCCFTDDRLGSDFEDNTDVCTHDLQNSYFANNVRHGFGVYDSKVPTYCTAFKWDEDQESDSYQYRGNALFDISFGTFLRDGYVKNIPGAPLCSCIEDMPVVTNAACRKVNVANERYTLTYSGNSIDVIQDNVDVTYVDCGQDFKSYHYGDDMEDAATALDEQIVEACDTTQEAFLNDHFLVSGTTDQFDIPSATQWKQVAGKGLSYYPTKTLNLTIRDQEFREYFDQSPNKIIHRHCPMCQESHQRIFYRRLTGVPGPENLNFIDLFLNNWFSTKNTIHVDFELYSTYEDALLQENEWAYCNYDHKKVGFPRDCGPTGYVGCQWNSYTRGVCNIEYSAHNHGFYIELNNTSVSSS